MTLLKSVALAALLMGTVAGQAFALSPAPSVATNRVVGIDGANNFRDIGGYKTSDGREVKWGIIYRSAAMNKITPTGFDQLRALGIKTNVDFRATQERQSTPMVWPADMKVTVYSQDYDMDMTPFMAFFRQKDVTAEQTKAMMATFYRDAPFKFAGQYKRMLRLIIDGQTPMIYNCSAGKDRTGVATALILTLLSVPRETVIEDYLLSNQYYKPEMPKAGDKPDPMYAAFSRLPPEVVQALMGVDRTYLEAAFAEIEARGGWERYVREDLGLTAADEAKLKTLLLK
ncbi:tyrosine-protein phosphatase [Asticcacaulis machinosus]|uniref:Tyrosine-protein phosphatase n=1 Tax=Asticcacaulis machinosus TaxID=2984211 RepID=A0ABT5HLS6_9CAUL|nr:tyrosine-protein phosphatase [Asticcacaulis machinosus]MDC7677192.1 tyrosine-protein phosphatase [Asticcacaulis machinosus]